MAAFCRRAVVSSTRFARAAFAKGKQFRNRIGREDVADVFVEVGTPARIADYVRGRLGKNELGVGAIARASRWVDARHVMA